MHALRECDGANLVYVWAQSSLGHEKERIVDFKIQRALILSTSCGRNVYHAAPVYLE